MLGQVAFSSVNRGASFLAPNGNTFYLLNGQSVSRSSAPDISPYWPSGYYGSTDNAIHLPDVSDLYVRGHAFNRTIEAGQSSRTSLSGILPSGTSVGTLQLANLRSHVHSSGTQSARDAASPGNNVLPGCGTTYGTSTTPGTTNGIEFDTPTKGITLASGTAVTDFDVAHTKCYIYVSLGFQA